MISDEKIEKMVAKVIHRNQKMLAEWLAEWKRLRAKENGK